MNWVIHFCHTCSLCRVELVVQFPARGSTQVLLCLFPGVLWLWHFLYSVGPHPVSSLHIYTFVVSRAFMAGAASQAGDADSSRAPGLTSGLQGSVNVHRGTLLLVPQWQCISSFVFYILAHQQHSPCTAWFEWTCLHSCTKGCCHRWQHFKIWWCPEGLFEERTHLVKYRSNIWHNLFNNEACQKALNLWNRKCSLAWTKRKTIKIKHMDRQ